MKHVLKLLMFGLLSIAYWYFGLAFVGLLTYASVCHYPDVPGCETDMSLPGIVFLLLVTVYALALYGFHRWTKNDPRGGYRDVQ